MIVFFKGLVESLLKIGRCLN